MKLTGYLAVSVLVLLTALSTLPRYTHAAGLGEVSGISRSIELGHLPGGTETAKVGEIINAGEWIDLSCTRVKLDEGLILDFPVQISISTDPIYLRSIRSTIGTAASIQQGERHSLDDSAGIGGVCLKGNLIDRRGKTNLLHVNTTRPIDERIEWGYTMDIVNVGEAIDTEGLIKLDYYSNAISIANSGGPIGYEAQFSSSQTFDPRSARSIEPTLGVYVGVRLNSIEIIGQTLGLSLEISIASENKAPIMSSITREIVADAGPSLVRVIGIEDQWPVKF